MKKKIKNKLIDKTAPLTRSLAELMKDEDGFVSKETVLKVGLSTVAALGIAGAMTDIGSGAPNYSASSHSNYVNTNSTDSSVAPNCVAHTNVTTHTSY